MVGKNWAFAFHYTEHASVVVVWAGVWWGRAWAVQSSVIMCMHFQEHLRSISLILNSFFCCAFRNFLLLPSTSWEPHFNYQPLQDAVHFPGWALVCTSECPGSSGLLVCWDTNRACGFLVRAALKMCWNVLSARARGWQNNSSTPWLSK